MRPYLPAQRFPPLRRDFGFRISDFGFRNQPPLPLGEGWGEGSATPGSALTLTLSQRERGLNAGQAPRFNMKHEIRNPKSEISCFRLHPSSFILSRAGATLTE